jgi:hypothetical protein
MRQNHARWVKRVLHSRIVPDVIFKFMSECGNGSGKVSVGEKNFMDLC